MRGGRARPRNPLVLSCSCDTKDTNSSTNCDECLRRSYHEWVWADAPSHGRVVLSNENRNVTFNPGFSVGTAAIRGKEPLRKGWHHYWEIEMSTEVYGTDMMIGVGTEQINLDGHSHSFVSLIGIDEHGWGLSYSGNIYHNGKVTKYTEQFGQDAVIGIHLDMWNGTMEFYLNRKPLGVAFSNNDPTMMMNLQNKVLYPVISSTAARSGMNLVCSRSFPPSLQLQCLLTLGKNIFEATSSSLACCGLELPPGIGKLIKNNYWWIVTTKSNKVGKKKAAKKSKARESDEDSVGMRTRSGSKKRLRAEFETRGAAIPESPHSDGEASVSSRVLRSGSSYNTASSKSRHPARPKSAASSQTQSKRPSLKREDDQKVLA